METMIRFLEEVLAFLVPIISSTKEMSVIVPSCVFSIIGFIALYKKGPWLGVPLSLSGTLMILMGTLARLRNYLFLTLLSRFGASE